MILSTRGGQVPVQVHPRHQVHPLCLDQVHPPDQVHPRDQVQPPWDQVCPLGPGTPPGIRYTPWDQVHPLDQVHPPDQVHIPLGPGTHPHPQDQVTPPKQCMPGDMGSKRAVRILLECILVVMLKIVYRGPTPILMHVPIPMQMGTAPNLVSVLVLIGWNLIHFHCSFALVSLRYQSQCSFSAYYRNLYRYRCRNRSRAV